MQVRGLGFYYLLTQRPRETIDGRLDPGQMGNWAMDGEFLKTGRLHRP
jgi:hypothetical protein